MRADDLTNDQCRFMAQKLRPAIRFLRRLCKRLIETRFPETDPLSVRANAALLSVQELSRELEIREKGGRGTIDGARPLTAGDTVAGTSVRDSELRERMRATTRAMYRKGNELGPAGVPGEG